MKVLDKNRNQEIIYHIVGSPQVDPINRKISDDSPIGRALIGKSVGDVVRLMFPQVYCALKFLKFQIIGGRIHRPFFYKSQMFKAGEGIMAEEKNLNRKSLRTPKKTRTN